MMERLAGTVGAKMLIDTPTGKRHLLISFALSETYALRKVEALRCGIGIRDHFLAEWSNQNLPLLCIPKGVGEEPTVSATNANSNC